MVQESALEQQDVTRLLQSIAEQLKVPLSVIARQAELGQLTQDPGSVDLAALRAHATAAMTLVDCYLLGLQLLRQQASLALEPVSVASTLVDTAHALRGLAKQYGVTVDIHIAGRYEPVMAHRTGLQSALVALGYSLLGQLPAEQGNKLTLAVHRTAKGIVAGFYGQYEELSAAQWRQALALQGTASQPLAMLTGNGAGLFVADTIMRSMSSRLRVGRHQKQQGLVATLVPSQQLSFI